MCMQGGMQSCGEDETIFSFHSACEGESTVLGLFALFASTTHSDGADEQEYYKEPFHSTVL